MLSVFYFLNSSLIETEPCGYVVVPIASSKHRKNDRNVSRIHYDPASTSFCQYGLLFGCERWRLPKMGQLAARCQYPQKSTEGRAASASPATRRTWLPLSIRRLPSRKALSWA